MYVYVICIMDTGEPWGYGDKHILLDTTSSVATPGGSIYICSGAMMYHVDTGEVMVTSNII